MVVVGDMEYVEGRKVFFQLADQFPGFLLFSRQQVFCRKAFVGQKVQGFVVAFGRRKLLHGRAA